MHVDGIVHLYIAVDYIHIKHLMTVRKRPQENLHADWLKIVFL